MRKSFSTMVSKFQKLPHIGLKVTMKNGSIVDITDFHIKENTVVGKNGAKAHLNDIDYIEIDTHNM